jgi:hypothetical protein
LAPQKQKTTWDLFGEKKMHDPHELRNLSRECRERAKSSIEPEVIEQLRRWAVELADAADEIERECTRRVSG